MGASLALFAVLAAGAALADPSSSPAPVVYRTFHAGAKCASAVTGYELNANMPLNSCLPQGTDSGNPTSRVKYTCTLGNNKYSIQQLNYGPSDTFCSQTPVSTDVVRHDYACQHDAASGFWVQTHCGTPPPSLRDVPQLVVKVYDNPTCTAVDTTPVALPTRSLLLESCQPVFNAAATSASGRKNQHGTSSVLYYRKVTYKSGPVGAAPATWDAGVAVTSVAGTPLPAEGAVGTAVGPLTLLVQRYNFDDKACLGAVKFAWTVHYNVQAATTAGNQCLPDPLFPSKFYRVAAPPVPTAAPTSRT